ncbi:MAG: glycosyltransferase [Spirochaetaceae bacterium]|nr:glycosyltransferase [Spirochaetaceae bacterium]
MKILFDMRVVQFAQNRGIGNYSINLIETLVKNNPEIESEYLIDTDLATLPSNVPAARLVFLDRLEYLDRTYDVFFNMGFFSVLKIEDMGSYIVPAEIRQRSRLVVGIVYDLIPLVFKEHYLLDETVKRRYLACLESANAMDHLFCISRTTKEDLLRYSRIHDNRATVINGAGKTCSVSLTVDYDFQMRTNTLVYIAGDDYRKNLVGAAESFALAYSRHRVPIDSLFYIVCNVSETTKKLILKAVRIYRAEDRVVIPGYLPDEVLSPLVQSAKATVFPSLYEGLGMPVLESYSLGTPVFAGDNSSLRELTHPDCRFDASDIEATASAYVEALTDKTRCENSVLFGEKILSRFSWRIAGEIVYRKICDLLVAEQKLDHFNKVAICTSLPPDENGVAVFTANTFGKYPDRYCFFSASERYQAMAELKRQNPENPATVFPFGHTVSDKYLAAARAQLYIIGNNDFSAAVLEEAVKWKDSPVPRYAYFHDGNNTMALYHYLGSDFHKMKVLLLAAYPERRDELIGAKSIDDIFDYDIPCFSPMLMLTQINKAIVTTEKSREHLLDDVRGKMRVSVDILPLPIERGVVNVPKRYFNDDTFVIGHFGYPSQFKRFDLLVKAVQIAKKKRKCALLLAGYGDLGRVVENSKLGSAVRVVSGLSQEELYAAMAGADVAVQLRYPFKGESLVVIHELLGLGKRIITTRGFIDSDISDLIMEVEPTISAEALANVLLGLDAGKQGEQERASRAGQRRSSRAIVSKFETILNRGENEGAT